MEDSNKLEADEGFCLIVGRAQLHGGCRRQRREQERRWRQAKQHTVPLPTAAFRYLEAFHDEKEENRRVVGRRKKWRGLF